jgi:hypothetical protein
MLGGTVFNRLGHGCPLPGTPAIAKLARPELLAGGLPSVAIQGNRMLLSVAATQGSQLQSDLQMQLPAFAMDGRDERAVQE